VLASRPPVRGVAVRVLGSLVVAAALVAGSLTAAQAATVPGAPTRVLAIGYDRSLRVGWFAPESDGGSPVTGYRLRDTLSGTTWTVPAEIEARTLTGLTNGVTRVLRVAAVNALGTGPESAPAPAATPHDPFPGARFAATGSMFTARTRAEAVRLADGRVLVVGGFRLTATGADIMLASAELYSPATGTWSRAASLPSPRSGFSLNLLPGGKVLLAGGYDPGFRQTSTAYLYTPADNTWKSTGRMTLPRADHVGLTLRNGTVLAAGGTTAPPSATAATRTSETYSVTTGRWTRAGLMTRARTHHQGALLAGRSGVVLVAGGDAGGAGTRTAELYRPASRTWVATGSMTDVRGNDDVGDFTMTVLGTGKVLVAGGYGTGVLRSAELYDPATGTWRRTGSMPFATQGGHTATLLRDGTALVVAGMDDYGPLAVSQIYVPATGRWRRGNDLSTDRVFATATLLTTGRVLVAGGTTGFPSRSLATAERYG